MNATAARHVAPLDHDPTAADCEPLTVRVSNVLLRALADVSRQRGVAIEQLLGHRNAALLAEAAEGALTLGEFQAVFARAVELTKQPGLGLLCGLQASEASFGLMTPLVAHAPTLRRALGLVCQFESLLVSGVRIRLREQLGTAQLRCDLINCETVERSFAEFLIAGLVRTLRAFGCGQRDIIAVCFSHRRPTYHACYSLAFAGVERFSEEFTGIEFSAQALDRPNLHHHSELHALVLAQAERSLQRLSRPLSCTDRVRAFLLGRPASQLPDMVATARELGLSVRSLRRRLEDEGTSYRELSQRRLQEQARSLLRQPDMTLQGAAYAIGFSDATAFSRAFRRWTGLTPAEYRAAGDVG